MKKSKILGLLSLGLSSTAFGETIKLSESNTFSLLGPVNGLSMGALAQNILKSGKSEVNIVIYSPGGAVMAAMDFVDLIEASGVKTNCIVKYAASAAFAITQACTKRYILRNGIMMQHQASYGLNSLPMENQKKFNSFLLRYIKRFEDLELARLGWTQEDYFNKTKFDYWVIGDDAVKDNVVDSVALPKCAPELFEKTVDKVFKTFFGSFVVTYSGCPLITAPLEIKSGKTKKVNEFLLSLEPQNFDKFRKTMKLD